MYRTCTPVCMWKCTWCSRERERERTLASSALRLINSFCCSCASIVACFQTKTKTKNTIPCMKPLLLAYTLKSLLLISDRSEWWILQIIHTWSCVRGADLSKSLSGFEMTSANFSVDLCFPPSFWCFLCLSFRFCLSFSLSLVFLRLPSVSFSLLLCLLFFSFDLEVLPNFSLFVATFFSLLPFDLFLLWRHQPKPQHHQRNADGRVEKLLTLTRVQYAPTHNLWHCSCTKFRKSR